MTPPRSPSSRAASLTLIAALVLSAGCSDEPKKRAEAEGEGTVAGPVSSTAESVRQVRQNPTPEACQSFLQELNSPDEVGRVRPMTELEQALGLSAVEVKELRRPDYSALDGQYMASSLLFADVAKGLQVAGRPAPEQAATAMAWVHRNVVRSDATVTVAPAKFVALRGSGNVVERAYVFLEVARQLGLDACLIGPDVPSPEPASPPFWLAGVLADGQVHLLDPWAGTPLNDAEGKPGTLAELRAEPDRFGEAMKASSLTKDVKPDGFKSASILLAPPMSAVTARMSALEEDPGVRRGLRVNLAVDAPALKSRFEKSADGAAVKWWNPAPPILSPARLMATFLPASESGIGTEEGSGRGLALFKFELMPKEFFPAVFEQKLDGKPKLTLLTLFAQPFIETALTPSGPHDRMVRGEFSEAIRLLTSARDRAREQAQSRGTISGDKVIRWCELLQQQSAAQARAESAGDRDAAAGAEAAVAELILYLNLKPGQKEPDPIHPDWKMFRDLGREAAKLVRATQGQQLALQATFSLAVCVQEKAEWVQRRIDRAGDKATASTKDEASAAWKNAAYWWDQYLSQFRDFAKVRPDRHRHATEMATRAKSFVE